MAKKIIRLTEGDLHRVIEDSVRSILREMDDDPFENDDPPVGPDYDPFESEDDDSLEDYEPFKGYDPYEFEDDDTSEDDDTFFDDYDPYEFEDYDSSEDYDSFDDYDPFEDYDPPVDPSYNPFYVDKLTVNGEDITDGFLRFVNISNMRIPNNVFENEDEFKVYLDIYFQHDNIDIDLGFDNDGKPVITTSDPRYDMKVIGGHKE